MPVPSAKGEPRLVGHNNLSSAGQIQRKPWRIEGDRGQGKKGGDFRRVANRKLQHICVAQEFDSEVTSVACPGPAPNSAV